MLNISQSLTLSISPEPSWTYRVRELASAAPLMLMFSASLADVLTSLVIIVQKSGSLGRSERQNIYRNAPKMTPNYFLP